MPRRISVMFSSRVKSRLFPGGPTLLEVRAGIQAELEADELLFERRLYDVWRNENEGESAERSIVERSLQRLRQADIVLALYNGDAGTAVHWQGGIGICHLEMHEALDKVPARLRIVQLPSSPHPTPRDDNFRKYVTQNGGSYIRPGGDTAETVIQAALQTVADATTDLAHRGALDARRGAYGSGDALEWSRLDFATRRSLMLDNTADALGLPARSRTSTYTLARQPLFLVLSAVPDAFGVTGAREQLGQPFRTDHEHIAHAERGAIGPFHVVPCHKGTTVSQVRRVLGVDEATIVPTDFGAYAADEIAGIQMAFLTDCRDPVATQAKAELLRSWLNDMADRFVITRAQLRRRLCDALNAAPPAAIRPGPAPSRRRR